MKNCVNCNELIGNEVEVCPFCGHEASKEEIRDLRHEKIKQQMVYEEACKENRERLIFAAGVFLGDKL